MFKPLICTALIACSSVASAATSFLSVTNPIASGISTTFNGVGLTGQIATLTALSDALVTYTYRGASAGFTNAFFAPSTTQRFANSTTPGTSYTTSVGPGTLDFAFRTNDPNNLPGTGNLLVANGSATLDNPTFAIFSLAGTSLSSLGDYLLTFDDRTNTTGIGGDRDFNDLQVTVSAIPEPSEWAMMIAGLGLVGAIAARRKRLVQ